MLNVRVGRSENRQLATGWHVVADITCESCASKLGWKYVDAKEQSQKYKVGKYILETERVVTYRNWEDVAVVSDGIQDSALTTSGRGEREHGDEDEDSVSFDSGDEDECEDVFAGTWDPEVVSMRRNSRVASSKGRNGSG